jgi:hypothetical protein
VKVAETAGKKFFRRIQRPPPEKIMEPEIAAAK